MDDPLKQIPKVDIYCLIGENWYLIKSGDCYKYDSYNYPSYGSRKKQHLKPVLPRLPEQIYHSSYAAVGSIIYASGGLDWSEEKVPDEDMDSIPASSDKVFYIDTLHPQWGWRTAPPMNVARDRHEMVADRGKMYVFGGLTYNFFRGSKYRRPPDSTDGKRIFAEVYDPLNSNAGWEELASVSYDDIELPQTIYGHAVVGEHDDHLDNRMILFHDYSIKGLYYLGTNRQQFGVYDDKFAQHYKSSTFLDGVLYSFCGYGMYAYDISTCSGKHQAVDLRHVKTNTLPVQVGWDESMPIAKLKSLGNGHLALVWAFNFLFHLFFTDVYCSIIKMSKEGDLFVGDVLTCSTYCVKRGDFEHCMVLCAPEEDDSFDSEDGKNTLRSNKRHQLKRKWDVE